VRRVVLDASAVMSFFENRPGSELVEDLVSLAIRGERELSMSVVNWGEVFYSEWRMNGRDHALRVEAEIAQLPIEIVDANLELARLAAELHAQHKLHYGDCFAVALGRIRKAAVATADKGFSEAQGLVDLLWVTGT